MKTRKRSIILALAVGLLTAALPLSATCATFSVTSSFKDGDVMTTSVAFDGIGGDQKPCGGSNRSPMLAWTGAPAQAQSFAVTLFDPDGRKGQGVSHWIAYNIAPTTTSLAEAVASQGAGFTVGKNTAGMLAYRGPCPPTGDPLHHYLFTVYALDIAPTLPAGLDRDGLFAAIGAHIIANTSIVGRYAR